MSIQSSSMTIVTSRVQEVRRFYEDHLDALTSFDCGWYIVLRLGRQKPAPELCLMEPQDGMPEFSGGITLNLQVEDVDKMHQRAVTEGLIPTVPLEDHPWGDRGFGIQDPAGITIYCYQPIVPSETFRQYFLTPA
ncbi:glyoxalase [Alkalilimnicola ehrlichii]|uniref:Glyoxalase n=1 Tax=Alkalilimnicola ehrlichii TaxID=351052 RepID=A0A3E0X3K7_9GAMM|nr:VOC family protein [Alkalilimnicola ehrlichii]RFA30956.1 glyoxalase [Alkalilimnicola ehrlichii]RFA38907.1 glyoxalase [Alkalilimnicola ehrlichii]